MNNRQELEDLKSTYSMTWASIGYRLDANDRLCSGQIFVILTGKKNKYG